MGRRIKSTGGSGYIANPNLLDKFMVGYEVATSNETNLRTYTTENVSSDPVAGYAKMDDGYAIVTYYSSRKRANYTVECYYENNETYDSTATSSITRNGICGTSAIITDADKIPATGYEEYEYDVSAVDNVEKIIIADDGSSILKLYFRKKNS